MTREKNAGPSDAVVIHEAIFVLCENFTVASIIRSNKSWLIFSWNV